MGLRIRLPEAVLARVAANAQRAMLTESSYQLDEPRIIARKKIGIAELGRFITQAREIFSNATASRLADRQRDRKWGALRKKTGSMVQCCRAESRKGKKSASVHCDNSTTCGSGQAKPRSTR